MIKSIKISNYKNLDGFEFDGFGRLNLITGRNNVGKTNLLEAISLNLILNIETSLRNINEKISNSMKYINLFFDINKPIIITFDKKITQEIKFDSNKQTIEYNKLDLSKVKNYPLIHNINVDIILKNYTKVVREQNKKKELLKALQIVDKNITDIEIFLDNYNNAQVANIYISNGKYLPISSFGDATQKVLNIFLNVLLSESSTILIDEVENGIYYENQKIFWTQLLELSKLTNCQIIATTHSLEMINAFYEVTKDEKDCKLLKLVRNIDNEISLREMEKELIEYILEDKHLNGSDVLR